MEHVRPSSTISQQIRRLKKRDEKLTAREQKDETSVDQKPKGQATSRKAAKPARKRTPPRKQREPFVAVTRTEAEEKVDRWFTSRGWTPFQFQKDLWNARLENKSGLLHVPTGSGKTYAAFIGALMKAMTTNEPPGTRILYITPLKAVSRDIRLALEDATDALCPSFHVEDRTGDTSQAVKARQKLGAPEVLVTTPESLSLLLTHAGHEEFFGALETVILDEWHELLGNKRGTLLELSLARLKALRPELATWALTATISNLDEAARAAAGFDAQLISADIKRPVIIDSLLPEKIDSFPWAGSLGLRMSKALIEWLDPQVSTLIFTNTRSQAERWYQTILGQKPEWAETMAIHHGSLERDERERVEAGIKSGAIKLVVATSSLDLGVDFGPVERVVQIGSPKGIARLLQRAGRASHRPGESSRLLFVPTHALELIEIASVRRAIDQKIIEARRPIDKPLDVLVQHLVSRALGGGFTRDEIFEEVRHADAFKNLTDEELDWALLFITKGGDSLQAYESFRRVHVENGFYTVQDGRIARTHRMNIGTIVGEATVKLKFQRGRDIGSVDEGFISRLKPGDKFLFSGRILQFRRLEGLNAIVKLATGSATVSPSWAGGRLPYSAPLSKAVRETLTRYADGKENADPEGPAIEPVLEAQRRLSALPHEAEILVELARTRDGDHFFLYPFEGRGVHEALGAILALRLAKRFKATFSITANDYGLELLSAEEFHYMPSIDDDLLKVDDVDKDLIEALNLTQMARQKFREIARVSGLLHPGHPGARKSARQLQTSAGLLYDVLRRYEPNHPLIHQAERQALADLVDIDRLRDTLLRIAKAKRLVFQVKRPTPLGFPLLVERWGSKLSTESLADRIERLKAQWIQV